MAKLQNALAKKIPAWRDDIGKVIKKVGDKKMSDVTVRQSYGGMRGVKCMICDTSEVPPDKGLLIRDIPLAKLFDKWPEEIFYLLCTGDLPNARDRKALRMAAETYRISETRHFQRAMSLSTPQRLVRMASSRPSMVR